jgi:hypothetical protein
VHSLAADVSYTTCLLLYCATSCAFVFGGVFYEADSMQWLHDTSPACVVHYRIPCFSCIPYVSESLAF